jgi:hypothetical protein
MTELAERWSPSVTLWAEALTEALDGADPMIALDKLAHLRRALDLAEEELVVAARQPPALGWHRGEKARPAHSWAQIGRVLGVSKQAAQHRFRYIVREG